MSELARVIQFPAHRREPEPLLTMSELVERYRRSERWFRYRVAEGMPSHRWGGTRHFRASEVEAWMEARYAAS